MVRGHLRGCWYRGWRDDRLRGRRFHSSDKNSAKRGTLYQVTGKEISELQTTFGELQAIVGDQTPSEVTAVGLLPSDRESLDAELERLVERHDLSIERTETGVIVR